MPTAKVAPLAVVHPGEDDLNWVQKGGKVALEAGGTNLYFALGAPDDDESGSWLDGATAHPLKLTLLYFDVGTETIQIGYSSDASAEIGALETVVTKGNTGTWKRATYTLAASMRVGHDVYEDYGYADFRLKSSGLLVLNEVRVRETTLKVKAVWQAAEVYIDESYEGTETDDVASEAITSGKIANNIQSDNYALGTSGWKIWRDTGDAEFNNVTVRGTIYATVGQIGGFNLGADYVRDAADSFGMASTVTGGDDVRFWAGAAFASRATAPFRVTEAGAVTASNIDLSGGSVSGTFTVSGTLRSAASPNARYELTSAGFKTYDSGNTQRAQILNDGSGWLGSSSVFSWTSAGVVSLNGSAVVGNSLDADKVSFSAPTLSGLTLTDNSPGAGSVAWSSFKLTYQGTSYTVSAGNTSSKYIYWKKSVSTTTLQTAASIPALAADTFIVAINSGGTAIQSNFAPFIYADYLSVGQLSAISADLGSITAGTITGAQIRTASSGARTEMHASNVFGLGYGGIGGVNSSSEIQWIARADSGRIFVGGAQQAGVVGTALYANVDITVGNTTVETGICSQSLKGKALRIGGGLHGYVYGTWLNNTAATRTLTIRFKYGATTITSQSLTLTVAAATGNFEIEFFLTNDVGATGTQRLMLHSTFFRSGAPVDEARTTVGTAAEDSTADQTVEVSAQWDASSANATLTMKMWHADLISR